MNSTAADHKIISESGVRSVNGYIAVHVSRMSVQKGLEQECEMCALWCVEDGCTRERMPVEKKIEFDCNDDVVWRLPNGKLSAWQ